MKKFFTILLILIQIVASAQNIEYETAVSINAAYDLKFEEIKYGASFTKGLRLNDNLFFGGGIGIDVYTYVDLIRISNMLYTELDTPTYIAIPMFVTIKNNFTQTTVSPFFMIDLGYNVAMNTSDDAVDVSGVFLTPSIGIDFNFNNDNALFLRLGCEIQQNSNLLTWELEDGMRLKGKATIGFHF